MCGIAGMALAEAEGWVEREALRRMTEMVRYRGPDSQGFHLGPGVGLGVQRLAINDLQTGDQPISSEDGTVTVVCNGEIYNFVELRERLVAAGHRFRSRSDVEVIVHLYEDEGPACVRRLRGMFAFALWDARRRRLVLARDRFGIKPLHYAETEAVLLFGSEQKSILAAERVGRDLDLLALDDLFSFGFVRGPRTMFRAIRRLQPGHVLVYEGGRTRIERYWSIRFPERGETPQQRDAAWWAEALRERLKEVVRLHLRGDVALGAWLSPGLDSSSVVALMSGMLKERFPSISLGFADPEVDELRRQRTLEADPSYGLDGERAHCGDEDFGRFRMSIWHCEDPFAAGIEIPRLILSEAAARRVKVVLTGEGSDEVFCGYPWYAADRLLRPLAGLPLGARRLMAVSLRRWRPGASRVLLAPGEMRLTRYRHLVAPIGLERPEAPFSEEMGARLERIERPDDAAEIPPALRHWHPLRQLQYYDLTLHLPDYINHQLDRASMAYGLEARVPFLDHELVEFCAEIPPDLVLRGLREKHALREAMREVLPREIVERRKRSLLAPRQGWLRGELPEELRELLSPASLAEKGYFSPEGVGRRLELHRTGQADFSSQLMAVLGVQMWDELFRVGCRATVAG